MRQKFHVPLICAQFSCLRTNPILALSLSATMVTLRAGEKLTFEFADGKTVDVTQLVLCLLTQKKLEALTPLELRFLNETVHGISIIHALYPKELEDLKQKDVV